MSETERSKPNVGWNIALGVAMTLFLGVVGAIGWLAYVWLSVSKQTRARISSSKRIAVIVAVVVALVAGMVGLTTTIVQLVDVFGVVAAVRSEDKAAMLSAGIAEAMNASVYGLVVQAIGVVIAFTAGVRLLRASS